MFAQQLEIHRFRDARVAPGLNDALVVGDHGVGGYGDDGNLTGAWFLTEPRGERESVLSPQFYVEENGMRR